MIEIISYISIVFFWLTGALAWYHLLKPIKENQIIDELGFDTSNRINRIKLFWLCLTRPWLFVTMYHFLTMDEHEQAVHINKLRGKK